MSRVIIAGGGAAGTLTAIHLARAAAAQRGGVEIVLIDPAESLASSAAFGTRDARHLLNVPASGMSAFPDDPSHFVAWRNETLGLTTDPYEFAPRRDFAAYVSDCLADALADAAGQGVRFARRLGRAGAVDATSQGVTVRLDDGAELAAEALVVATGLGTPSTDWAPPGLRDSPRFVADPWIAGALDGVRASNAGPPDLLIVGAGLTMIDIVLSCVEARPDRRIHAISRSGLMPQLHAPAPVTPVPVDIVGWGSGLDEIRERVEEHIRSTVAATGDWRSGIDGLRAATATLWQGLSEDDRAAFLANDAGRWNRARHRTPLASASILDELEDAGRFSLTAASVSNAEPLQGGGLRVILSDGSTPDVGWVINAAGPRSDVATLGNPLLDALLDEGLATPATGGMGFLTDNGRLVGAAGSMNAPIYTLGALRRGELWESTAVPEIRAQAAALAHVVLDQLAS